MEREDFAADNSGVIIETPVVNSCADNGPEEEQVKIRPPILLNLGWRTSVTGASTRPLDCVEPCEAPGGIKYIINRLRGSPQSEDVTEINDSAEQITSLGTTVRGSLKK